MKRIKESPQEYRQTSPISSEGYLYVQEKRTQDKFYDVTLGCLLTFTDCRVILSCALLDTLLIVIAVSTGPPPFGSSWVKRYCTFVKEQKILHMKTFDQRSGGKLVNDHHT